MKAGFYWKKLIEQNGLNWNKAPEEELGDMTQKERFITKPVVCISNLLSR